VAKYNTVWNMMPTTTVTMARQLLCLLQYSRSEVRL